MEQERAFKGIWIPKEIWLSKDLTILEKILLVEIDSLDNEEGCFASNKYFAEFFGLSNGRISQIINELIKKNYLDVEYLMQGKQVIKRTIKIKRPPYPILFNILNIETPENDERGVFRKLRGGIKYSKGGYLENDKDNNINNNNIYYNKKKKNETEFDVLINENFQDEEVKQTIYEFIKMRKAIKKPLTTHGLKLIVNKLKKFTENSKEQIDILNNSIMNNWQGIYSKEETLKKKETFNQRSYNNLDFLYANKKEE